jgi:hypothetical protein
MIRNSRAHTEGRYAHPRCVMALRAARIAIICFAAGLTIAPVGAQDLRTHWQQCYDADAPEIAINSCTRIIESGQFEPSDLSWPYFYRANRIKALGNWPSAWADYARTIELATDQALRRQAYIERGEISLSLDTPADAANDMSIALESSPPSGWADDRDRVYALRAAAKYRRWLKAPLSGDADAIFAQAQDDAARALNANPNSAMALFVAGVIRQREAEILLHDRSPGFGAAFDDAEAKISAARLIDPMIDKAAERYWISADSFRPLPPKSEY